MACNKLEARGHLLHKTGLWQWDNAISVADQIQSSKDAWFEKGTWLYPFWRWNKFVKNTVWVYREASSIEFSNLFCLFEISITLADSRTQVRSCTIYVDVFGLSPYLLPFNHIFKKSFLCASLKHFLMKKVGKKVSEQYINMSRW